MALPFTNVPLPLLKVIIPSTHVTLNCEFIAFHRTRKLQKTPQGKSHGTEIFGLRNLSSRRKALFFSENLNCLFMLRLVI